MGGTTGTVIADAGDEFATVDLQRHMCPNTAAGVFEHIRQGLLDDAIDRERGTIGQQLLVEAVDTRDRDRQSGRSHIGDERPDVRNSRQRCRRAGVVIVGAEEAEERAGLCESIAPGVGDRLEDLDGRVRVGLRRVASAVGLGDDDRERMGDDVVHLAGDPHPLGIGGEPGLGFAFPFEQAVALPYAFDLPTAAVADIAEEPGDEDDRGAEGDDRGDEQILP